MARIGKTVEEAREMLADESRGFIRNGQIWEAPSYLTGFILWVGATGNADQYMLVGVPSVMQLAPATPITDDEGRIVYTQAELEERLERIGWRLLDRHWLTSIHLDDPWFEQNA
jgi:hypothetical protein